MWWNYQRFRVFSAVPTPKVKAWIIYDNEMRAREFRLFFISPEREDIIAKAWIFFLKLLSCYSYYDFSSCNTSRYRPANDKSTLLKGFFDWWLGLSKDGSHFSRYVMYGTPGLALLKYFYISTIYHITKCVKNRNFT